MSKLLLLLAMTLALGAGTFANSLTAQSPSAPQQTEKKQPGAETDQQKSQQKSQAGGALSSDDRQFVTEAAHAGAAEVVHSQLADQRASSDDVKQFARRLVEDHTKANQELTKLATDKGAAMPPGGADQSQLHGKHREFNEKLSKLSGADFDREFMRHQLKMHQDAVSLFERQANKGKDADLKAFAERMLPTLRDHQQAAKDVASKVGVTDKTGN